LESNSRLVPGGAPALRAARAETRVPLYTSGGYSVGIVAESARGATAIPVPGGRGALAVGGYVSSTLGADTRLTSSLRSDGARMSADFSAAYSGGLLGPDSTAAFSLGASWGHQPSGFSLNPAQPLSLSVPSIDLSQPRSADINVGVSLTHQVTPALSLGGLAEATRPTGSESGVGTNPGILVGAGMGYRF
jgi:hypothetical protein